MTNRQQSLANIIVRTYKRKVIANTTIFSYDVEMEAGRKNVLVKKTTHIMPVTVIACCLISSQREPVTVFYTISATMQPFSGEKLIL